MVLSFARSLGEFGATITFVSNIPGETRTIASAIYTLTQTPGGDAGALRLTLVSIALSLVALLAADLAGAPHRPAPCRRLNRCSKSISSTGSPHFELDIHFRSGRGLTALFGRSGAGKTSRRQRDRRAGPPAAGPHRHRRLGAARYRARHLRPDRIGAGSAMSFRRAGFFRISRSGRTCCSAAGSRRPGTARGPSRRRRRSARHRARCSTAGRAGCRAARSSGSRSAGRCWRARGCC